MLLEWGEQGVKVGMLGRQNESNLAYFWLALTSIFGLCFMPVYLIKSNCYSLIYSSLVPLLHTHASLLCPNQNSLILFHIFREQWQRLMGEGSSDWKIS